MKKEKLNKNKSRMEQSMESYCACSCNCSCANNCNCNPFVPTSGPGATGYTVVDVLSDNGFVTSGTNRAAAAQG
ncbi:MAG: hypothetical protein FWG68_09730 [Defluviitaleaceae bacterium]|nr:hypothetical protein [Defluviitaleaceae bacterium]